MNEIFGVSLALVLRILLAAFGAIVVVTAGLWLWRPVLGRMALRNIPRRPVQTVLIVIGLMLSTLIFLRFPHHRYDTATQYHRAGLTVGWAGRRAGGAGER